MNLREKFFSILQKGKDDECWNWPKGLTKAGYGQMAFARKKHATHRLAWSYANNQDIPKGKVILHSCDNTSCVNPNHLRIGTQQDNVRDMIKKGRLVTYNKDGANNPNCKIKPSDVAGIFCANGTHESIAKKYNSPVDGVRNLRNGSTWKSITKNLTPGARGKKDQVGSANGNTTLTESDVRHIYQSTSKTKHLSVKYKCTYGVIGQIKRRETWGHVTEGLIKGD